MSSQTTRQAEHKPGGMPSLKEKWKASIKITTQTVHCKHPSNIKLRVHSLLVTPPNKVV